MTLDILDRHRGVIDQDADGQGKTAECHQVNCLPDQAKDRNRSEHGKWNRYRDDDRAAPRTEKQQDHQCGQRGGDDAFSRHAANGRANKERLIGEFFYLHRRRNRFQNIGHRLFCSGNDAESGSGAVLEYTKQRAASAILPNDVLLWIVAIAHLGDVTYPNLRAIHDFDRQLVQAVDLSRKSIDVDRILDRAEFGCAAGKDERLIVDRGRDVGLRQVLLL